MTHIENIRADFFDNENWYIRLLLEGEDRLAKNQDVRIGKKTISYSCIAEDWDALAMEDTLSLPVKKVWIRGFVEPVSGNSRYHVIRHVVVKEPVKEAGAKRTSSLGEQGSSGESESEEADGSEPHSEKLPETKLMSGGTVVKDVINEIPHYKESPLVQKEIADLEKILSENREREAATEVKGRKAVLPFAE